MRVEIWSDIICPFCTIGKTRFEKALAEFEHGREVEVIWRSFELNSEPLNFDGTLNEWLAKHKGVSLMQAKAMNDRVADMARQDGLDFQFDTAVPANTFDAHRLTHFAATKGLRTEMTARLLKAYFTEGEDIGDRETLVRLAGEAGLPHEEAQSMLDKGEFATTVRGEEERAIQLGIQGVPFFLMKDKYGMSGAQSKDTFLQILRKVWDME
jgi:predicted DsbA family dithiol-disulfide isomerase